MSDYKLPTIEQLSLMEISDKDKQGALNVLLNKQPPSKFILEHPVTNMKYIPIEKIEFLLTNIFKVWSVEVKKFELIANSVCVCVRLHYKDPFTGEMLFQDGLGASPLQTDKGAGVTDFAKIKSSSVQMALPSAESYAVKDAAEKIGTIFGKDLGRKTQSDYSKMMPNNVISLINPQLTEVK